MERENRQGMVGDPMNPFAVSNKSVYLLFSFHTYYPGGGFDDLRGIYDTLEAAQEAVHTTYGEYDSLPADQDWLFVEELVGTERRGRWYGEKKWQGNPYHHENPGHWEITWKAVDHDFDG